MEEGGEVVGDVRKRKGDEAAGLGEGFEERYNMWGCSEAEQVYFARGGVGWLVGGGISDFESDEGWRGRWIDGFVDGGEEAGAVMDSVRIFAYAEVGDGKDRHV